MYTLQIFKYATDYNPLLYIFNLLFSHPILPSSLFGFPQFPTSLSSLWDSNPSGPNHRGWADQCRIKTLEALMVHSEKRGP